jgi:bifunctional non-homologous end joining protein LigD
MCGRPFCLWALYRSGELRPDRRDEAFSKLSFTPFVADPIAFFRRNRRMPRSPQLTTAATADTGLPAWVKPQLTRLVAEAPSGDEWAHELKFDGCRMHARLDGGNNRLLTRTGLEWSGKYPAIAAALNTIPARQAYLEGELCGVRPDGVTSFALIQNAADRRGGADPAYFAFDLLSFDSIDLMPLPLADRKARLAILLERSDDAICFSDHQIGQGSAFHRHVCELGLEGIVSKRLDAPYVPGDRGLWLKTKCLNREEFVVVGWTDPEGSRPFIGALLLGYYDAGGRLIYAGRVRYRDAGRSARRSFTALAAAAGRQDAARCRPAALDLLRLAAGALAGALGPGRGLWSRSCTKGCARTSRRVRLCANGRLRGPTDFSA